MSVYASNFELLVSSDENRRMTTAIITPAPMHTAVKIFWKRIMWAK